MTMTLTTWMALALGACAVAPTAPKVTVLPGSRKSPEQFRADSTACQQQVQAMLANDAQVADNHTVANVAVGTLIGTATGALLGQGSRNPGAAAGWGAGTGLLLGSAVGSRNSQAASYGMQQRFDAIYAQCMYRRGHQVPSMISYRRSAPATSPDYPPPNYPPPSYLPPTYPPPDF